MRVTAYGESFIEDGIPASELGDGWAIEFERFQVSFRDIVVAGVPIEVSPSVDLAEGSSGNGHELGSAAAPAGNHTGAAFTIDRLDIAGMATKDAITKSFAWVFASPTRYTDCETTTRVVEGETATFQITIHGDHLLYDSLVAAEPQVLFQPLADADASADGIIAAEELMVTDIGAYDPGSEGSADDFWEWLTAQSRTLGHVDGEGHCHSEPVGVTRGFRGASPEAPGK